MNEDIISRPIIPYLDVTALKQIPPSADLPLIPLVGKVAHAWAWEHPERNAAALRFIAAAERCDVEPRELLTPWSVSWAKSPGPSEILARISSFASLGTTRVDDRIVVVTAAQRGWLGLQDLASGRLAQLLPPVDDVSALAIGPAPGGAVMVSVGTEGGLVRCWLVPEIGAWRPAPLDSGYFDVGHAVTTLAATSGLPRPHLLVGQANGRITLVDCTTGSQQQSRQIHDGQVTGITSVELDDGRLAALSTGVHGSVEVSHLEQWRTRISAFRSAEPINAVTASRLAGGRTVAVTAGENGSVRVWELPPESPSFRLVPGHDQDVTAMAAGTGPRDEPLLITGDSHGRLRVVDPDQAKIVGGPVEGHVGRVTGLAMQLAADGRAIAISGGADGIVRSWDLAGLLGGAPQNAALPGAAHPRPAPVRAWRLDDGRELGGEMGTHSHRMATVAVGRLADGTRVAVTDAGSAPQAVSDPAAAAGIATADRPDGMTPAVSATGDGLLRFWDLTPCPGRPPRVSHAASHPGVQSVTACRSADGTPMAVSAGRDHVLKVWNMRSGLHLADLNGHEHAVTALTATTAPGHGPVVVSGSEDASLRAWNVDARRQVGRTFRGYERRITALAATWVGKGLIAVAACRRDPVVRWRDLLGEEPRYGELVGHDGPVTAVAVIPDPERPLAVTAGEDHTIRVWDLLASAPLRIRDRGADLAVDPMPVPGVVRAIACFDDEGPGAVIAGDDVLAVVHWDALDPSAAGRYRRASSTAALPRDAAGSGASVVGSQGVQVGSGNVQNNYFYYADQPPQREHGSRPPGDDPGQW